MASKDDYDRGHATATGPGPNIPGEGFAAAAARRRAARREALEALEAVKAAAGGGPANPAEPSVRCARGIPDRVGGIFAGAIRSMESGGLTREGAQRALDEVASGHWPDGRIRARVICVQHSGRDAAASGKRTRRAALVQAVVEAGK